MPPVLTFLLPLNPPELAMPKSSFEVTVGTLVVVNDLADGVVYQVERIEDNVCTLRYKSGDQMVSGGTMWKSMCKQPSPQQLKNAGY
jgi:hypothetical protein